MIRSVHVDTARTWRGGQNQVLQLVTGLEALGQPAVLVAHDGGELKRRANEGLRFVGFSPRSEFDVHAAWQLGKVLHDVQPDVVHACDRALVRDSVALERRILAVIDDGNTDHRRVLERAPHGAIKSRTGSIR